MSSDGLVQRFALLLVHCISTGCGRTTRDTQAVAGFYAFGVRACPPKRSPGELDPQVSG